MNYQTANIKVGHWEQESLKQFNKNIGEEELTNDVFGVWKDTQQALYTIPTIAAGRPLTALSRKELVCDMDNWRQQLKWLKTVRQSCNYNNNNITSIQ